MDQQQATGTLSDSTETSAPVGVEEAEAAIVEHYPRLVRLGYLVLPPGLGRARRVLTAHALVQRALPRQRGAALPPAAAPASAATAGVPAQVAHGPSVSAGYPPPADTVPPPGSGYGYVYVRLRVVRAALAADRRGRRGRLSRWARPPSTLPRVWGLRLTPRSGGTAEIALDKALSQLSAAGRAAFALREWERLGESENHQVLGAAGVTDPAAALVEATEAPLPPGCRVAALLSSPGFDPCSLQARPTDLLRRRQHLRAAAVGAAALAVCGVLLGLPGGWGPNGTAAPDSAGNAAAAAALDPGRLVKAESKGWRDAARLDFSVWPARGDHTDDRALLRRALAVWARPGSEVKVSATPGTQSGPPAGPPQLLYAGELDQTAVVLMFDGLRLVRYAEPAGSDGQPAALDFARVDAADTASAAAVVVGRSDNNSRYLTAPWVRHTAVRDLLKPGDEADPLRRSADGVTDPVPGPAPAATSGAGGSPSPGNSATGCRSWPAVEFGGRLMTDLGELTPARLSYGSPRTTPGEATTERARRSWAHVGCQLASARGQGVRSVNSWAYADQTLPEGAGDTQWTCVRAETWRGAGSRTTVQFQPPGSDPDAPGTVVARSQDSPACGPRNPQVLAGALWKAPSGQWYLLAGGGGQVSSISATGDVRGTAVGDALALPAPPNAHAKLTGHLLDGGELAPLR